MPYVEVNGHQIHYTDIHPRKDASLLTFIFIHGLGASENYFFPVLPYLTDNYRCVTLDIYGSARSLYMGDVISIESITSDVCGILEKLNVSQVVVVGHSMGGIVANLLAAEYKERVLAIVGIGPTHPTETVAANMKKRIETVAEHGVEPIADTVPNQATGRNTTPLQKAFLREMFISQNPQGYAALCNAIATAKAPDYAAITAPYILIVGDEDKSATLENCTKIFDNISSSFRKMELFPGIGHWYCVENSDGVGRLLYSFGAELKGWEGN